MTASDTSTTTGIPNNGGEGFRFCGFPAFDGLIDWDFTHPERIAGLTPGLASEWKIDDGDHTRWVFTIRGGVKFHDGTDVTSMLLCGTCSGSSTTSRRNSTPPPRR
jgi:peptide/nickel transport system substrate-binding protein